MPLYGPECECGHVFREAYDLPPDVRLDVVCPYCGDERTVFWYQIKAWGCVPRGATLRTVLARNAAEARRRRNGTKPVPVPHRKPVVGFVYFMGGDAGAIKIGFSVNPATRLSAIQTGSPTEIQIIGQIKGPESLERVLHNQLAAHRIRGEWFDRAAALNMLSQLQGVA